MILNEIFKRGVIRSGRMAQFLLWSLLDMYAQEGKQIYLGKDDALTCDVLMKECMEVVSQNLHIFDIKQVR